MKMTEETKPQIVKSKPMVWRGKEYTETLTSTDVADMKKQADIFKLNGWSEEGYIESLAHHVKDYWKDEALEVFQAANPELKVGLGATMNLYSDRRAMTIVEVVSPRKIIVQGNNTRCLDYYAGNYEVLEELVGGTYTFTLRKNGTWVEEGQPKKWGSVTLSVGYRRHYIDPSF